LRKENLLQQIGFLSHTVDPEHDTLPALRAYAQRVGADTSVWHFVTGNAEDIYWQAQEGYMLTAFPSDTADGGFFHTDKLTLVDRNRHIRGYYDGTSTKDVDRLYTDIKKLIHESDKSSN
jgi:protein SCO1/2